MALHAKLEIHVDRRHPVSVDIRDFQLQHIMLQRQIAFAISIAALITIAVIAGCGETTTQPQLVSSVGPTQKDRAADTRATDLPRVEADRELSRTREEHHFEASRKVVDIMLAQINLQTVREWAKLLPNSSADERQAFAEKMLRVFHSDEFRRDYSTILMETFTAEECERLSELLSDPVLKKFQQRKAEYMARMISLAEKYFDDDGIK